MYGVVLLLLVSHIYIHDLVLWVMANPWIGHPLGCTGTRQVVTVLSELKRRKAKVALTSMCVGTGMGMAGIFVSEQ